MKAKFHIATREYSFIEPEVEGSVEEIIALYFEFESAYRAGAKEYRKKLEEPEEPPFKSEQVGDKLSPTKADYLNKK